MKLPPYSKSLYQLIKSGQKPSNIIYLYIGDKSWEKGKISIVSRPERTLILPPGDDPLFYDWPVKDCEILIVDTSLTNQDYLEKLVAVLFASDACKVMYTAMDFSSQYFKKEL